MTKEKWKTHPNPAARVYCPYLHGYSHASLFLTESQRVIRCEQAGYKCSYSYAHSRASLFLTHRQRAIRCEQAGYKCSYSYAHSRASLFLTHSKRVIRCEQAGYQCSGCGSACGLHTSVIGTLNDGSGSANYPAYANCKWIISPFTATWVSMTFSAFQTELNTDFVRIYQCSSKDCASPQFITGLSGSYASTQTVTASTGTMLIWFSSDRATTNAGFTASWTSSVPVLPVSSPHTHTHNSLSVSFYCIFLITASWTSSVLKLPVSSLHIYIYIYIYTHTHTVFCIF